MHAALRTYLEDLARHQYRHPRRRSDTYRRLVLAFPDDARYLRHYCQSAYLADQLTDLEVTLLPYLRSEDELLRAIAHYWQGNACWAKGDAEVAIEYWQQVNACQRFTPEGAQAERRRRIAEVPWKIFAGDGVVLYVDKTVPLDSSELQRLHERLSQARRRFTAVVGEPFAATSRIYLYPNREIASNVAGPELCGCADTDLGEVHATQDTRLLAALLFTVDGRWPNYHPELFAGLSRWAEEEIGTLRDPEAIPLKFPGLPELLLLPVGERGTDLQIASLLEYLIESHGWGTIIRWMREPELIGSFPQHFGASWKATEQGWKRWLGIEPVEAVQPCSRLNRVPEAEVIKVALEFWGAVSLGDWNSAARLTGDPSSASRLRLDLGANPEMWKLDDFTPVASYIEPNGGEAFHHYVFGDPGKPWAVCWLHFKRSHSSWRISDWLCRALEFEAWENRCAEGYTLNRPFPGELFRKRVLDLARERNIERPVICEIGVGTGRVASAFVAARDRYIGLDRSLKMMEVFVRQLGSCPENLHLIPCDVFRGIPIADESVDIVLEVKAFSSLNAEIIRECARILRPQGFLLAHVNDSSEFIPQELPLVWRKLLTYQAQLPALLNVHPWPAEESFRKPEPLDSPESPEPEPYLPAPDRRWTVSAPFVSLTYDKSLRLWLREGTLKRTVLWPGDPEPWWSERHRLLEREADRLGLKVTDTTPYERRTEALLWEAATLKRWVRTND